MRDETIWWVVDFGKMNSTLNATSISSLSESGLPRKTTPKGYYPSSAPCYEVELD